MTTDPRYAADVGSIDAIVGALYQVISGPAGPRDFDRERHLFHPSARLMRGLHAGSPELAVFTVEDFVAHCAPRFLVEDFHEWEIGREEYRFGRWAHVVSAYETRRGPGDPPHARGINSIQLWHEQGRWWVVNMIWDWERPDLPIPPALDGPPRR